MLQEVIDMINSIINEKIIGDNRRYEKTLKNIRKYEKMLKDMRRHEEILEDDMFQQFNWIE